MISLNPKDYLMAGLAMMLVAAGVWIMLLRAEVGGLEAEVDKQAAHIEMQKLQISAFVTAIDKQNEAIEGLKVSTLSGIDAISNKAKTVETRYSTVKVKDDTCEARLQAYNELIGVFLARGSNR